MSDRPLDASGGDWHEAGTGGARTHQDEIICDDFVSGSSWPCEMEEIEVTPGRDWPDDTPPWPDGGGGGEGGGDADGGGGGGGSGGTVVTPWGKAIKVGRKLLQAADRGEDLLDVNTWKRIGREEWDALVSCGIDGLSAASGDTGALLAVLNCAADLTLGVDFYGMVKGLKLADRLGLNAYTKLLRGLKGSRAAGAFANGISDLDLLYDFAKLGQRSGDSNRVYRMMEADASAVFSNFSRKWQGRNPTGSLPDIIDNGRVPVTRMILRQSSTEGLPTIEVQGPFGGSASYREIRFGSF